MDARSITYITLEVLIGTASLLGNLLVLFAVAINHRLRTVTNWFIVSLALADIFVGAVAIPCAIASYNGLPSNSFYGCVFVNSIVIMFTQSSVFSLLGIAIERFTAIKYPYAYANYFTDRNAIKIIAVIWVLSILIGLIPIMGWNLYPPTTEDCAFTDVIDMEYMVFFNFFLCILLPLVIMFGFYGYIFHIVRKQMKQIAALQLHGRSGKRQRQSIKEIKAAKSLAMVLGFFAVCWLPIHIMNSITVLCGERCNQPYDLLLAAILLSHANSAVNPLLYAFGNSQFKSTFKHICCCGFFSSRPNSLPSDEVFTVSRPYSNEQENENKDGDIEEDVKSSPNRQKTNGVVMNMTNNMKMKEPQSSLNDKGHDNLGHTPDSTSMEEQQQQNQVDKDCNQVIVDSQNNSDIPVTDIT